MASDLSEETTAEGAATHGIGPFGGDDGGGSCDDDHHGGISTTVMTTKGRPSSSIIVDGEPKGSHVVERAVWQCEVLGGGQRAMRKCGEFCDGSEKAANSSAEGESLANAVCLVTKIRDGGAYINCQDKQFAVVAA